MKSEPKCNRPQEPKPPFPYQSIDVSYVNSNDNAKLAGTLTIPNGKLYSTVVLIHDSGSINRDLAVSGHKPFLVIADYLTRQGIAVLRSDNRGVDSSTSPKNGQETIFDLADDVISAVNFLKTQPEINQNRIGLIGYS